MKETGLVRKMRFLSVDWARSEIEEYIDKFEVVGLVSQIR